MSNLTEREEMCRKVGDIQLKFSAFTNHCLKIYDENNQMMELLQRAFVVCHSNGQEGDGYRATVELSFRDLEDAQLLHRLLVTLKEVAK